MLPGVDGSLSARVDGTLLALLPGVPYRRALLRGAAPIVAVQLSVLAWTGIPSIPMLGIELAAFGLFGLPLSRLPRRSSPAPLRSRPPRPAHP